MSSEIKVKCRNPHEFLVSIVYSLSFASRAGGSVLHSSLLGLGYIFTALDIPAIYNTPAPDFLLVNIPRRIVIAVECKGEPIDESRLDRLRKKFSAPIIDAIRSIVQDRNNSYVIEFVIHTFDVFSDYYAEIARRISEEIGNDVILWTTTAVPQIPASIPSRSSTEYYTLKKYTSKNYTARHHDQVLDEWLNRGILVREDDIVCNPLVDPNADYQILFYEISYYILRMALSDEYRGRRIKLVDLVHNIKRDYQSHVKSDRIIDVVIDIFSVFPWLGEFKQSSFEVEFKKMPRVKPNIMEFMSVRESIKEMSYNEAKKYIAELKRKKNR